MRHTVRRHRAVRSGSLVAFPITFLLFLMTVIAVSVMSATPGWSAPAHEKGMITLPQSIPARFMNEGGLFLPSDNPERVLPAPLVATEIDSHVSGIVARTTVRHTFLNPTDRWTEAIYTYPLPTDSAVDRLKMIVGSRVIDGKIQEKLAAKRAYTRAKQEGKRASLVEQQRPNMFTTHVANIAPADSIVVEIQFQERIEYRDGGFSWRMPLVVGPRYEPLGRRLVDFNPDGWTLSEPVKQPPLRAKADGPGNPVTLTVHLDAGVPLAEITSASHAIDHSLLADGRAKVSLYDDAVPADRDFQLAWAPKVGAAPQAGFFHETRAGERYGLLMVLPPALDQAVPVQRREVIFVLDVSGSMEGPSIDQAKAALVAALDRLGPDDRFQVIWFNDQFGQYSPVPVSADEANLARAKRFVQGLEAGGGTEVVTAAQAALRAPTVDGYLRQVVFLTDGAISAEEEMLETVLRFRGQARLFTVGIGVAPNGFLMTRLAEAGRGAYTFIQDERQVGKEVSRLFAKLENPVLTDLAFDWGEGSAVEVWPNPLPDLYAGEPVFALLKLDRGTPAFGLEGRIGGRAFREDFILGGGRPSPGIAALWGREKIKGLTDRMRREYSKRDELRGEIVDTAIKLELVSQYTSLVAIDDEPARPGDEALRSAEVPTNLPHGWSKDVFRPDEQPGGLPDADPMMKTQAPGTAMATSAAALSFDRGNPALAHALGGQAMAALPQTATPAHAYMALGILFLLMALAVLLQCWGRAPKKGV